MHKPKPRDYMTIRMVSRVNTTYIPKGLLFEQRPKVATDSEKNPEKTESQNKNKEC